MKEEALKLADELEKLSQYVPSEAPDMIRKLVAHIEELENPIMQAIAQAFDETKELSDEEVFSVYKDIFGWEITNPKDNWVLLAREIERRIRCK
jgi:hypothetical protein